MRFFDHGVRNRGMHLSNEYADLSKYVGSNLIIVHGVALYAKPVNVKFLADYKNTILIEMEFIKDFWNPINPKPRYVRQMIPKCALAVGEVKLINKDTGERLYGSTVAPKWLTEEEAAIV